VIKELLHKVFSISLALIVLCSTVSFTVEKHYCGTKLVDVSVFSEADKCKMEAFEIESEKTTKKPCCKDEVDMLQGQDELIVKTFSDLDIDQQVFLSSFTYSYLNLFESLPQLVVPHKNYSPPNLVADIQVLDQVFII
jgi:hypothetical protein